MKCGGLTWILTGIPEAEGSKSENGAKTVFEKTGANNSPKLVKDINLQI